MTFHVFHIDEIYSNPDGNVQFVEFNGDSSGQEFWSGHQLNVTQNSTTHTFNFTHNLPGDTSTNTFVLVATQGYADLAARAGLPTPDFIVPNGFLFVNGSITVVFPQQEGGTVSGITIPRDGTLSSHGPADTNNPFANVLSDANQTHSAASPENFAGVTGVIPLQPIANVALSNQVTGAGQLFSDDLPANAFFNVDGDVITYTAALTTPDASLPAWLSVDSLTGALSGTPTGADAGTYHVTLTATDNDGIGTSGFDLTVITGQVLSGGAGNDSIPGTAGDDSIAGLGGDDTIDGTTGNDSMLGGAGNDTYFVDSAGDQVTEASGQGTDTVVTSVALPSLAANVENLTLASGTDNLDATGNSLNNILTGNDGDNTFNGAGGADTFVGGAGNDTYLLDSTTDQVVEGADSGTDTVITAITLPALAANVENILLTGSANIAATGNALPNSISGNDGDNTIDGGAGADTMAGGNGNDTYLVDDPGDFIALSGGGVDKVISTVSYSLAGDLDVENLSLSGAGAVSGTGNGLDNVIVGSTVANTLDGGLGNDTLTGGTGADVFSFTTLSGTDRVTDFVAGTDKLQLDHAVFAALAPGALPLGGLEITTSDQISNGSGDAGTFLKYASDTGQLYYDDDGSGGAGTLTLVAVLGGSSCSIVHPALTASDIIVS